MSSLFYFASASHTWGGHRDNDGDDVDDYDGDDDDDEADDDDDDFCLVPILTMMVISLMFL